MLQGIAGHGFYDSCVVPIIENTARECELTGRLREAMAAYPRSNAVLVRRHGIYIWGDTWLQARANPGTKPSALVISLMRSNPIPMRLASALLLPHDGLQI